MGSQGVARRGHEPSAFQSSTGLYKEYTCFAAISKQTAYVNKYNNMFQEANLARDGLCPTIQALNSQGAQDRTQFCSIKCCTFACAHYQ